MSNLTFAEKLKGCNFEINKIVGKTFFITGATGLIGKSLATLLLQLSETNSLGIKVVLLVRDRNKLSLYLKEQSTKGNAIIIERNITEFDGNCIASDYVVHCASITESKKMISNPTEVIRTNIYGTMNVLDYAKKCCAQSTLYLSSMEAYGFNTQEEVLAEENMQYLNPLEIRSCYPESKRMAENICISYASEFEMSVKIVRLAQTFGKGVDKEDKRVFAEFARCAVNKKDIVLKTDGASARMYLDVEDAVTAILVVLINGENSRAYNVANNHTYCSIAQMASLVAERIGNGEMRVVRELSDVKASCYPPAHKLLLDTTRIEALGWKPYTDLIGIYKNMLDDWSATSN